MPKYKTHLAGGLITSFIFVLLITRLQFFEIKTGLLPIYIICCLLGSLFPDIDTKSMIQKILYYPLFLIILFSIFSKKWFLLVILSFVTFIPILANHRRLTHKIWFLIFVPLSLPILAIHYKLSCSGVAINSYLFFLAGALSHIFLDFGPKKFFK